MREGAEGEEEQLGLPPQHAAQWVERALGAHAVPRGHVRDGGKVERRHRGGEGCGQRSARFVGSTPCTATGMGRLVQRRGRRALRRGGR
jgi:hypothetical protein